MRGKKKSEKEFDEAGKNMEINKQKKGKFKIKTMIMMMMMATERTYNK